MVGTITNKFRGQIKTVKPPTMRLIYANGGRHFFAGYRREKQKRKTKALDLYVTNRLRSDRQIL